jgi:hypothetical protein
MALTRASHRYSSRGRRGAVPGGVFDSRRAESYLTVRRALRGEKTSLGGVHRRPQQKAGDQCGLTVHQVFDLRLAEIRVCRDHDR